MKLITVPPDVELLAIPEKNLPAKAHSFWEWLETLIDQSNELCTGIKNIYRAHKLCKLVEDSRAAKSPTIQLEDADYATLKASAESTRWSPRQGARLIPFFKAFEDALDVPHTPAPPAEKK